MRDHILSGHLHDEVAPHREADESQLLNLVLSPEPACADRGWRALITRYGQQVEAFFRRKLIERYRGDAEGLASEVFVRLWKRLDQLKDRRLESVIRMLCRDVLVDFFRSERRRSLRETQLSTAEPVAASSEAEAGQDALIERLLPLLRKDELRVFWLRIQGQTWREVASRLGIVSPDTSEAELKSALRRLRKRWERTTLRLHNLLGGKGD